MPGLDGLFQVLDTRSFPSLWYWLMLAGIWTWVGRGALGVPADLVRTVDRRRTDKRRPGDGRPQGEGAQDAHAQDVAAADALLLLDWLSLVAPRWRVAPREGAILLGLTAFLLSGLASLGFAYGLEMAQALVLLAGPLAVLGWLRLRLAAGLRGLVAAAERGALSPDAAAAAAARRITRHMRWTMLLSILAVAGTALWGTLWMALHPNGL